MLPPNNIQPNFIETKAFAFAPQSHNSHYTHFWAMLITPQNHSPFRRYWGRRKEGKKLAHTHTHRHTHRHTDTHTHTHTRQTRKKICLVPPINFIFPFSSAKTFAGTFLYLVVKFKL